MPSLKREGRILRNSQDCHNMNKDLLSISRAAAEYPRRLAIRSAEDGDLTFGRLNGLVQERLSRFAASPSPVPLVAQPNLDSLLSIYALLELGKPMLILHPQLTEVERHRILDFAGGIRERLPEDTAVIIFTSGTTGTPKPTLLSRKALIASALSSARNIPLTSEDVWQLTISPARVGGLSIVTRSLIARSALSFAPAFRAKAIVDSWERDEVTLSSIVPTMLMQILEECPQWRPAPKMRALLVGGAPTSLKLKEQAASRGVPLIMTYGMTEAASNVVSTPYELRNRVTVGSGKANDGAFLEVRENGRLWIKGPMLLTGYWGRKSVLKDGWFDTGDIGSIDKDGFVSVKGRQSDVILSGGDNVYPSEVEEALESLPAVKEALALALPDEMWGAIVTTLLVAKDPGHLPDAKELADGLKPILAKYKFPRRYAWVDSIPRTSGGKPDRNPARLKTLELKTLHYLSQN